MGKYNRSYICILISTILCFTSSEHAFGNDNHVKGVLGSISSITTGNDLIKASNVGSVSSFNVKNYGAKGDGRTDDSAAFLAAFGKACQVPYGIVLVPAGSKFLLQTISFVGSSCKPNITFQVEGKIVAPLHRSYWKNVMAQWILFDHFRNGIKINGKGVIDGSGQNWWDAQTSGLVHYDRSSCPGTEELSGLHPPNMIRIGFSADVTLTGIMVQNSPWFHLVIFSCTRVTISGLNVYSPAISPNTDGIHLSKSQHIDIHNCNIAAGDDCVSIQNGTYDVKIHNVHCGPGHGYSIGSLGECQSYGQVSQVSVYDSTIAQSLTGVRIKTWQGGSGFVSNIKFQNIHMDRVKTAIEINQHYCGDRPDCSSTNVGAVAISGVLYKNITGTYTNTPVRLNCSANKPCRNITINTIQLDPAAGSGQPVAPICSNAYGRVFTYTKPPLKSCLRTG